jgi:hypothetical protein
MNAARSFADWCAGNGIQELSQVQPFHVAAFIARSAISSSNTRFNLPALQLTPQLSVRQIPVSEFTLFSSATIFALSQSGDTGRLHSEGDLIISGAVSSLYPVTASGNISLADQGSLVVQPADPGLAPLSFPVLAVTVKVVTTAPAPWKGSSGALRLSRGLWSWVANIWSGPS